MTYTNYEFTAFAEADLLQGVNGDSIGCGDTFVMPAAATTCITVGDDDPYMSGDCRDHANDHYGQHASIMVDGDEAGNGGQIYAEVYHWVCDQHGNWYVMIEIEQEGTNDDYFAFFNGYGYSTPPAGAVLTVGNSCDVRGNWIDYQCLDSGEKAPETGSISGTVFCDTDCDGLNAELTTEAGCDYTIEAESMHADGFKVVYGAHASDNCLVKLECGGGTGDLTTTFDGKDGKYDLKLSIQDECDGQSTVMVKVNGEVVGTIVLDQDNNGGGSNHGDFSVFTLEGIELNAGDEIVLWADGDAGEWVRIDKLDLEGHEREVIAEEPAKEGVTINLVDADGNIVDTTVTDADGNYSFDGIEAGNYKIMGVAPDGTEFTIQDAGSDDSIDSDVDANGMSGTFTINAGDSVDVDLGVCDITTGSISGTVFCDTDCDGLNGSITVVPGENYTIEAESMHADGFKVVYGAHASDNCLVKLECGGGTGDLTTTFDGENGAYNLKLSIQDECDGQSTVMVKVNGDVVGTIVLDQDNNGGGSNHGDFSVFTLEGIELSAGDEIVLCAEGDAGEWVRIDKIDLEGLGSETITEEPVKEGVEIKLIDADGNVVDTTFTDADGNYSFDDVDAGDYKIMGVAPDGTEFTIKDAGSDDSIDSDVDADGMSDTVTVVANGNVDVDLGVCDKPTGTIAGRYFCDDDNDDRDNGDPAVANKTVWLLKEGVIVDTTTTDADGNYSFGDVEEGSYAVRFEAVEGKEIVTANVGDDDNDSDVTSTGSDGSHETEAFRLEAGEDKADVDAGVEDAPGSISGRFFVDTDNDNQDNNNGDEPGVEGVLVTLVDENGVPTGDTATTDSEGNYSFDNVRPGNYGVIFTDPDNVLDGKVLVDANDGDDASDSDAIGDTGSSTITGITVVSGEDTPDNDAGVEDAPGSISGRFFCDTDNDNQDNNNGDEPGVEGVLVTLVDKNGVVADQTTTTAADGSYTFDNVRPGEYDVVFTDPDNVLDGKVLVDANDGDDVSDSDAIGDTGSSTISGVTIGAGEASSDNDAGVEDAPGSISGRFFVDTDNDNQDNNNGDEPGVEGVLVTLVDENGVPTGDTATTDSEGNYSFDNVRPGNYGVIFTDPDNVLDGKVLVDANDGDDASDSDAIGDTGSSTITGITVVSGEDTPDNDAGVEEAPGSISGRFFCDTDNDNQDNNNGDEPGVEGVLVTLVDKNGVVADQTTTTAADGSYTFDNVRPGEYDVVFTDPDNVLDGKVLVDANDGDDVSDSDAIGDTGSSTISGVTIGAGEASSDNDAGVEDAPGSISGRFFVDTDNDNQDNNNGDEPGVEGVLVTLVDENGVPTGDTATTDSEGNYSFDNVRPGNYGVIFTDPDNVLDGKVLVDANDGDDASDSDAIGDTGSSTITGITVVSGEDTPDNDAGVEEAPGSISGRFFCDTDNDNQDNNNGDEPGVEGVLVTLVDKNGVVADQTTTTAADGSYTFDNVRPGEYDVVFTDPDNVLDGKVLVDANDGDDVSDSDAIGDTGSSTISGVTIGAGEASSDNDAGVEDAPGSISGRFFVDTDNDNQDNNNGDEPGVEGVLVTLVDENGVPTGDTATTDSEGNYSFDNVRPGNYGVIFTDPDNVLDGKVLVDANDGDDASDSDAIGDTGSSTITGITVVSGEDTPDNDAGVEEAPGSISGRFFCDTDNDNQDNNNGDEPGVEGVLVTLVDKNGVVADQTTTTAADGSYTFDNVRPGEYDVVFTDPDNVLDGKVLVDANDGDDVSDSDAIGDTGSSTISGVTIGAGEASSDNDAGVEDAPGSISGRFFVDTDNDNQDNNNGDEPGVEGVLVTLVDENGVPTGDTATTDSEGNYSFDNVRPGNYGVIFTDPDNVLDGKVLVDANDGDDASDSDAIGDTGSSTITGITVVSGEDTPDNDAGVEEPNTPPTAEDDAADTCYDTAVTIDVLANDTDLDNDTLTVTEVNGMAIDTNTVLDIDGVLVSLDANGDLSFDGSTVYADLRADQPAEVDQFVYTVDDGNGGTATANVEVTFCGATDTLEKICASLENTSISFVLPMIPDNDVAAIEELWTMEISSTDARLDGLVIDEAYCVDLDLNFVFDTTVTADVYVMDPSCLDGVDVDPAIIENFDSINWILNNRDTVLVDYTDGEIQGAIWGLTNDDPLVIAPSGEAVDALEVYDMAIANDGYVVEEGGLVGLYIDPTDGQDHDQPFVIGVDLWVDCLC